MDIENFIRTNCDLDNHVVIQVETLGNFSHVGLHLMARLDATGCCITPDEFNMLPHPELLDEVLVVNKDDVKNLLKMALQFGQLTQNRIIRWRSYYSISFDDYRSDPYEFRVLISEMAGKDKRFAKFFDIIDDNDHNIYTINLPYLAQNNAQSLLEYYISTTEYPNILHPSCSEIKDWLIEHHINDDLHKFIMVDHLLVSLQPRDDKEIATPIVTIKLNEVEDILFFSENFINNADVDCIQNESNYDDKIYCNHIEKCNRSAIKSLIEDRIIAKYPELSKVWFDGKANDSEIPYNLRLCVSYHDARYKLFDHLWIIVYLHDYDVCPQYFKVVDQTIINDIFSEFFGSGMSHQFESIEGNFYSRYNFDASSDCLEGVGVDIIKLCQKYFKNELAEIFKIWSDKFSDLKDINFLSKKPNDFALNLREDFFLGVAYPIPQPDDVKLPYVKLPKPLF